MPDLLDDAVAKIRGTRSGSLKSTLNNQIQEIISELSSQGYDVRLGDTVRTPAQQAQKVAEGRSRTYKSHHLTGDAADLIVFSNGQPDWNTSNPAWRAIGEAAKRRGLGWGGDFQGLYDPGHVQVKPTGVEDPLDAAVRAAKGETQEVSTADPLDMAVATIKAKPVYERGEYGTRAFRAVYPEKDPVRMQRLNKLAHDIEWHFGASVLTTMPQFSEEKQRKIIELATQYAQEDEEKKKSGQPVVRSTAWQQLNQERVGVTEAIKKTKLLQQFGQQRTVDREGQLRKEVVEERRGRRGAYGTPTPSGILHLIANPIDDLTGLFSSEEENVNQEVAERLRAEKVAREPEVTSIRKEYGKLSPLTRSVAAPVVGRGSAGLLKVAGGVSSIFGIAPNRLSEWANKRGEIIETASLLPPLKEEQTLSSLVTGNPELKEVEKSFKEKLATAVADVGVGVGQIILLKKATGLPLNQLMALEAAAKHSDKPLKYQMTRAVEGYALGSVLEKHLSRGTTAALFGIPTAAQTGYEVSQERLSPLDAALQTAVHAGMGALLTPARRPAKAKALEELQDLSEQIQIKGYLPAARFEMETVDSPLPTTLTTRAKGAGRVFTEAPGQQELFSGIAKPVDRAVGRADLPGEFPPVYTFEEFARSRGIDLTNPQNLPMKQIDIRLEPLYNAYRESVARGGGRGVGTVTETVPGRTVLDYGTFLHGFFGWVQGQGVDPVRLAQFPELLKKAADHYTTNVAGNGDTVRTLAATYSFEPTQMVFPLPGPLGESRAAFGGGRREAPEVAAGDATLREVASLSPEQQQYKLAELIQQRRKPKNLSVQELTKVDRQIAYLEQVVESLPAGPEKGVVRLSEQTARSNLETLKALRDDKPTWNALNKKQKEAIETQIKRYEEQSVGEIQRVEEPKVGDRGRLRYTTREQLDPNKARLMHRERAVEESGTRETSTTESMDQRVERLTQELRTENLKDFLKSEKGSGPDLETLRYMLTKKFRDVKELGSVERKRNVRPEALRGADQFVRERRAEQEYFENLGRVLEAENRVPSDVIDLTEQPIDVRGRVKQFLKDEEGSLKLDAFRKRLVSSPTFRKWFVSSKVRDPQGKPMRVYHGTTSATEITTFKSKNGGAIFFAESVGEAARYADPSLIPPDYSAIYPAYISVKKPHYLNDFRGTSISYLVEGGIFTKEKSAHILNMSLTDFNKVYEQTKRLFPNLAREGELRLYHITDNVPFAQWLKKNGYDGFTLLEGGERIWGVLEPTQIKSAIGNRSRLDRLRSNIIDFLRSEEGSLDPEELARRIRELLKKNPNLSDAEIKTALRGDSVEYRNVGVDPREAVRLADNLNRAGVKIERGELQDFSVRDWIRKSPLSNLDFKGYFERVGGESGKKVSDTFRNAQVKVEDLGIKWEHEIGTIVEFLEKARKEKSTPKKEFYSQFVDLVEKPFGDPLRRPSDPNVRQTLEKHDQLTSTFKEYIKETRAQLGIDMPADWGITDRGYFRHLFLGDIQVFMEKGGTKSFYGTARTYAEAQKMALEIVKKDPSAEVLAQPRTNFFQDPTVRLSSKKFWATVSKLTRSVRHKGGALTKADILEDITGVVGQRKNQQKFFGPLLHREGYGGYLKDYARVMEIHAQQLARTQELTKLNRELQPLIEQLKTEGKPGLAEDAQNLLDTLWGKPSKFELAFGNEIRKIPILRNHIANPDSAFRNLASRLTQAQRILRLDFNARASIVNALDPWSTLWPYVSTREFVGLYADYLRPATRQMLRERGVSQGATKLEAGVPVRGKKYKIPRPFHLASEMNRGIGYLYGLKDGARKGLEGDALHRYGLEWAKKVEFDNSLWNVAPVLRSPGARILGQFKGYPLKQIEHIGTLARKQEGETARQPLKRVGKFVGAKVAAGGVKAALSPVRLVAGYFGYEVVSALSSQLQQYGMEKDDADKAAQAVYYGTPALIGQDLSASVAVMDDFYGTTPEEKVVNLLGGPTVGTMFRVSKAKDWKQFASRVSPLGRLAKAGEVYESGGKLVVPGPRGEEIELTPFESTMYLLGFTPVKQTQSYEEDTAQREQYKESQEKVMKDLAREFNKKLGIKSPIIISEGEYEDLTNSLESGGDLEELRQLLETKSRSQVTDYYSERVNKPFTRSNDREIEFKKSLTPEQMQLYNDLKVKRRQQANKVRELMQQLPATR